MPRTSNKNRAQRRTQSSSKRSLWIQNVHTVSTFPPEGLFTKDAHTIARVLARKDVSPKGIGSAIRMVTYFINRGGRNLSAAQKRRLESAKRLLQERRAKELGSANRATRWRKKSKSRTARAR